jgi:hypothetical protein
VILLLLDRLVNVAARILSKWSIMFNFVIKHWDLRDLDISGRCFIWPNNQVEPIVEKLDIWLVQIGEKCTLFALLNPFLGLDVMFLW